jgi:AraC-like DNA-binding protein
MVDSTRTLEVSSTAMNVSQFSHPSTETQPYVRCYVQRRLQLGASTFVQPVPARAAHVLDFEFGGPIEIRRLGTDITRTAEPAALVGLLTYQRNQLLVRGNVETFVIFFQPAAIHQLFGLPPLDLINRDYAAHAVLGPVVSALQEQLGNARSFGERVQIADQFIVTQSFRAATNDPIELVAKEIMRNDGGCRIDSLAHHAGLSIRNFQRMFQQRVGVSPKLFARIVRFEAALKSKAARPHLSWTMVAHEFGYHDQMHMIHDFQQLSGETPSGILGQAEAIFAPQIDPGARDNPERLLL